MHCVLVALLLLNFKALYTLNMKQLFVSVAVFLSATTAYGQVGGSQAFTVPLAGKVELRAVQDKYGAQVTSLEAPEPDGQSTQAEYREMKAEVERRFPKRRSAVAAQAKGAAAALQPIVVRGFVPDSNTSIPPDNYMAVNNGIEGINVMNSRISILHTGTGALTDRKTLQSFTNTILPAPGPTTPNPYSRYDPKVMYDQEADRFYFVTLAGVNENNYIIVGFSQSSDPAGTWNFYKFYGDYKADSTWFDYPTIAITKDEVFLTGNKLVYNGSFQTGFRRSVIYQMRKRDGYAGQPLTTKIWDSVNYGGAPIRNLFPVKGGASLKGPKQYFLSVRNMSPLNDSVFLVSIDDTLGSVGNTLSAQAMKSNLTYGFPPNGRQPKIVDKLQTNDARVLGAYIEGNEIQFVSTTVQPATGADAIYHGVMSNVAAAPAVQATYITVDTMDLGFPNISYSGQHAGANTSIISFDYSGPSHYPGVAAVFWDGVSHSELLEVKQGDSSIKQLTDTVQRWGDYTGSQPKWNNMGHVWIVGLYGKRNKSYGDWMALLRSPYTVGITPTQSNDVAASLFPNPAYKYVRLRFALKDEANVHFALYSMNGALIDGVTDAHCERGENELQFNVASLAAGQYVLKGTGISGEVLVRKVFVKE
jgi:hypothetical protein